MSDRVVGTDVQLAARLNAEVAIAAARATSEGRRWSIAVSGGSVATSFFPQWGRGAGEEWASADIFWADERAVPPDSPDSNYGLARALWLGPAGISAGNVHRMAADGPDLDQAATAYADELARTLGAEPTLDVVLLGIGPDGHVASLFPGHPLLAERTRTVAAVIDSPKPPPARLTLTMPVLTRARLVVIGAFGAAKAGMVRAAIEDPDSPLPVALVARGATRVLWLLDADAAGGIGNR
jgi:6-phosphogluconolactonase